MKNRVLFYIICLALACMSGALSAIITVALAGAIK